jgi:hypothetical protein
MPLWQSLLVVGIIPAAIAAALVKASGSYATLGVFLVYIGGAVPFGLLSLLAVAGLTGLLRKRLPERLVAFVFHGSSGASPWPLYAFHLTMGLAGAALLFRAWNPAPFAVWLMGIGGFGLAFAMMAAINELRG